MIKMASVPLPPPLLCPLQHKNAPWNSVANTQMYVHTGDGVGVGVGGVHGSDNGEGF